MPMHQVMLEQVLGFLEKLLLLLNCLPVHKHTTPEFREDDLGTASGLHSSQLPFAGGCASKTSHEEEEEVAENLSRTDFFLCVVCFSVYFFFFAAAN